MSAFVSPIKDSGGKGYHMIGFSFWPVHTAGLSTGLTRRKECATYHESGCMYVCMYIPIYIYYIYIYIYYRSECKKVFVEAHEVVYYIIEKGTIYLTDI